MAYHTDVFISYPHNGGTKKWVQEYFAPLLIEKLQDECLEEPEVFLDTEIPNSTHWKNVLLDKLKHSKLLLMVWSPPYFRSQWCQAEWQTFLAREQAIITSTQGSCPPTHLPCHYNVVFADGDFFPEEAQRHQNEKMHDYALTAPAFKESLKFVDFEERVRAVAQEIARRLNNIPPFDPTWKVCDPGSISLYPMQPTNTQPSL